MIIMDETVPLVWIRFHLDVIDTGSFLRLISKSSRN
jgi:hypothetical protein